MLFIYYFWYDPTFDVSQQSYSFFKDIEDGNFIGVISTFSIMEYIGVVKSLVSKKLGRKISIAETEALKESFLDFIRKMGILLYNSDDLTINSYSTSCSLFSDCENLIESADPTLGSVDRKWHSLKGADALHIILAIRSNATHFATFDDDFRGVKDAIKMVMVREEY